MADEWKPPSSKLGDGGIIFHGWQGIRAAIESAYQALGRGVPKGIPPDDWNLVGLSIDAYNHASRSTCIECKIKMPQWQVIRCLDCKAPLCENCAPKHFWPNGRRPAPHPR